MSASATYRGKVLPLQYAKNYRLEVLPYLCSYGNLLDQRYGTDAFVHDFEELSFYLPTVHSVSTSIVSFQSTVHSGSVYLYSILLLRVLPVTALFIRISPNSRQTVYTYLLDFLD